LGGRFINLPLVFALDGSTKILTTLGLLASQETIFREYTSIISVRNLFPLLLYVLG
jgi:hypothetical protein